MPMIADEPLNTQKTWQVDTLLENDGLVLIDAACCDELLGLAEELAANPLPTEAHEPDRF